MSRSQPLTFGELKIGDRFIGFPTDGDDSGHGGYRGGSYLFEKIGDEDRTSENLPLDNAKRLKYGSTSHVPLGMNVLLVL